MKYPNKISRQEQGPFSLLEQFQSTRDFENIFDALSDGVTIQDKSGQVIYANPAMARIIGFKSHLEFLERDVSEIWQAVEFLNTPEVAVSIDNLPGRKALRGEKAEPLVLNWRNKLTDLEYWSEVSSSPVFDAAGKVTMVVNIVRDITAQRNYELALKNSELRFRALIENISDGLVLLGSDGVINYASPAFCLMFGYTMDELAGRDAFRLLHADDFFGVKEKFDAMLMAPSTDSIRLNFRSQHKSGSWIWMEAVAKNLLADKSVRAVVVNFRDVTEKKRHEDQIKYNYHHDSLTDLPNRLLFNETLGQRLQESAIAKEMLGVVLIDLDRFKLINESLGHAIGDRLLQEVALRLKGVLGEAQMLARLGGDEFGILIPCPESEDQVAKVCLKVLDCLKSSFTLDRHELYVTPSIGISMYPFDGEDPSVLLRNADTALYRAKEQGRNNFQFYTPAMNAKAFERLSLENTLRKALNNKEFVVYYIPQIEIMTGKIVQVESLIRWMHPDLGLTFPDEFIELAETTGLIEEIGEWVLRDSMVQVKKWHDLGFTGLRSAINMSGRQFKQRHLVRMIHKLLNDTGFPPDHLELEVRENTVIENTQAVYSIMSELKRDGIKFAMDDFNAAHSSLKYIKMLPIDVLKIDRWGLKNIPVKEKDTAIVNSIINLAHSLNMTCVAEGVERLEQLQFLKQQKCDLVQGYLFSPPVEADKLTELLFKNKNWPIKF